MTIRSLETPFSTSRSISWRINSAVSDKPSTMMCSRYSCRSRSYMSNHWFILMRLNCTARLFAAVGKMNLTDGKVCARVLPVDAVDARSSVPNFGPLLPRPWRRIVV
ncbi:hypothetical protein ABW21_db0207611 [Orbilia brochopaga]|nr:hypothetical protein ABW21_db0207611 [Drechslerella brochopaga]